jgi:hypothetical protein
MNTSMYLSSTVIKTSLRRKGRKEIQNGLARE